MAGNVRRGFIPIGGLHHASRAHAAGFCVFNDCGVAIEQLRRRHGVRRVAYVDIDAHHGDGVFYAFESDPDVLFADIHEDGRYLYPGTGRCRGDRRRRSGRDQAEPAVAARGDRRRLPSRMAPDRGLTCGPPSPSSSCSSAAPTASRAIRSRTSLSARRRMPMPRPRFAGSPDELGHGRVLAMGGGGYNRQNLARAWTRVVEALVEPAVADAAAVPMRARSIRIRGRAEPRTMTARPEPACRPMASRPPAANPKLTRVSRDIGDGPLGYNCRSPTVELQCFPPA